MLVVPGVGKVPAQRRIFTPTMATMVPARQQVAVHASDREQVAVHASKRASHVSGAPKHATLALAHFRFAHMAFDSIAKLMGCSSTSMRPCHCCKILTPLKPSDDARGKSSHAIILFVSAEVGVCSRSQHASSGRRSNERLERALLFVCVCVHTQPQRAHGGYSPVRNKPL